MSKQDWSTRGRAMSVGWIVVVAAVERAASDTVDFAGQNPVAEWHAEGLWNMEGLGTFNGQPLSETNQPSTSQRRLACSNGCVRATARNCHDAGAELLGT
jgi:hypothetical protein